MDRGQCYLVPVSFCLASARVNRRLHNSALAAHLNAGRPSRFILQLAPGKKFVVCEM